MTDGANPRRQPAEDRQMGMNIESCCTEGSNKCTGERRYRVMEVKQCASSGTETGNKRQGRGMFPPYLRAWTRTAKWSTWKRKSYVIPSCGETDKPKEECKEKRE